MSHRIALILVAVTVAAAGCSRTPERSMSAASPTSPTIVNVSAGSPSLLGGGAFGPLSVAMPSRQDQFAFRQTMETKYQISLRRPVVPTPVDLEGDAIWTGDYLRYRVSGCDHGVAVQRVMAQVAGNPPGPDCGVTPEGIVPFPPLSEVVSFRRGLDDGYIQMGRMNASAVDLEGSGIWQSEYNRYRVNACDHATATAKVLDEIDGAPASPVCYVPPPCQFYLSPGPYVTIGPGGGSFSFEVLKYTGLSTCSWTAVNEIPSWVTLTGETSGGDRGVVAYSVAQNLGVQRSGRIRLDVTGGGFVAETVIQQDRTYQASIELFDYKESTRSTTECLIKNMGGGNPTTCTLVATARLKEAANRYVWSATWNYYGVTRTFVQDSLSNTFTIPEQCNGAANTNGGDQLDLNVTVTVYDTGGNQQTVITGQGLQPAFTLRVFTC